MSKLVTFYVKLFGFKAEQCAKCEGCCPHITTLIDGDVRVSHLPPIIRYIGMKAHCPCYYERSLQQQAEVDTHLESANKKFATQALLFKLTSPDSASIFHPGYAKSVFDQVIGGLECSNKCLESKTYLVNERISIADFFSAYVNMQALAILTEAEGKKYGNVIRHIKTIAANFPLFEQELGSIVYAKQQFQIKAQKEKAEKPKAAEKPKEAEKPKDGDEEAAEKPKEEKKPKYTYKMDLNAWKRHYKNLNWDTEDWQDYFYKNFDGTDMSLWFVVYKDPSDFKVDWQTKNLFTILLQRLRGEKADQNSFGNFIVVKNPSQDHFQIIGVFLFAGTEMMQEYADCSGCQSFDFIRMDDWNTPEAKAFIKNVWDWSEKNDMVYRGVNYGKCTGDGETFV